MTVKDIIKDWLKTKGYEGLCNLDIPCGCLLDNLAPCDCTGIETCQAGFREDVDEHAACECDGAGTQHWHVYVPQVAGLEAHFEDAEHWRCECGMRCDPSAAHWRWNGRDWEHYHGYPVGYCVAKREPR